MDYDEAVRIRDEITSHSHYGTCLNGSRYSTFDNKRSELSQSLEYRKRLYNLKEQIIKENNELKLKEKAYKQNNEMNEDKYESLKKKINLKKRVK